MQLHLFAVLTFVLLHLAGSAQFDRFIHEGDSSLKNKNYESAFRSYLGAFNIAKNNVQKDTAWAKLESAFDANTSNLRDIIDSIETLNKHNVELRDRAEKERNKAILEARKANATQLALIARQKLKQDSIREALDIAWLALQQLEVRTSYLDTSLLLPEVVQTFGEVIRIAHTCSYSIDSQVNNAISKIRLLPNNTLAVVGRDKWIRSLNIVKQEFQKIHAHLDYITDFSVDKEVHNLVSISKEGAAKIYDFERATSIALVSNTTVHKRPSFFDKVCFLNTSSDFVTISRDGNLKCWDSKGMLMDSLEITGKALQIEASPVENKILVRGHDCQISVWDIKAKKAFSLKHQSDALLYDAAFSKDGQYIITCASDSTALLWDSKTGAPLKTIKHTDIVHRVLPFKMDSLNYFLTFSKDQTALLWSENDQLVNVLSKEMPSPPIENGLIGLGGEPLIVTWAAQQVQLIDPRTTASKLLNFKAKVKTVALSNDQKFLLAGLKNGMAVLWDIEKNMPVLQQEHGKDQALQQVFFSKDDHYLITFAEDSTLKICPTPTHIINTLKE